MNLLASQFLLPEGFPGWAIAPLAAMCLAGWVVLRRRAGRAWKAGPRARLATAILLGLAMGAAGLWLTCELLLRLVQLETRWPLWLLVAIALAGSEALLWLYGLERKVVSRRAGLALVGLRLSLLALVVLMLLAPVIAVSWSQTHKRPLAVLMDESASMQIRDRQLSPAQRLRLAEALGLSEARRPFHLEQVAAELTALRDGLASEQAWLDQLVQTRKETSRAQLAARRGGLNKKLVAAADALAGQLKALEEVVRSGRLPANQQTALKDAQASLAGLVSQRLLSGAAWTSQEQAASLADNLEKLQDGLGRALTELARVSSALDAIAGQADAALYAQLSLPDRSAVDAVAGLSRLELSRAVLLHRPDGGQSLLERLTQNYDLKVYSFASAVQRADPRAWPNPLSALAGGATEPATQAAPAPRQADDQALGTDYALAIRRFLAESGEQPAGVLMLSDGQDNGPHSADLPVRQLASAGGAFAAVLAGAENPPTDAAIVSLQAPDTVYLSDKMVATARLKLDGLDRRDVRVTLYEGDIALDTQTVRVTGGRVRTSLQFSDQPVAAGMRNYRLQIEPQPGEVFAANNACPLAVWVTDEKVKMLLVDDRPRWEFRYLKNLFCDRDKSVQLQYLLLHPDVIAGQATGRPVPASATRPAGMEEATALPASQQEWLKFDVVVLGDLSPQQLSQADQENLRKFVADRGGTAIFIAGPQAMPIGFAHTPLEGLLPLELGDGDQPPATQPVPSAGFGLALTDLGSQSVIMQLDSDQDRSREIWQSLPPLYRRSPLLTASATGTVLAYAQDPGAPAWLSEDGQPEAATNPQALAQKRLDYQRRHALAVTAQVGNGKVMVLNTDCLWRLRYRSGDLYHHRFWGQLLRWATAGKLPAGTDTVKIGADKARYAPGDRPLVRAKLIQPDYTPVVADDVALAVRCGDNVLRHVPLKYQADSPGMYSATLEELPPGAYKLELEGPTVQRMLGQAGGKVAAEISVDAFSPAEEVELGANRDLLGRLASLGAGGAVWPADQATRVLESLPAGEYRQERRFQLDLWDSWILLGLFCAIATAEWVLRKRAGLA